MAFRQLSQVITGSVGTCRSTVKLPLNLCEQFQVTIRNELSLARQLSTSHSLHALPNKESSESQETTSSQTASASESSHGKETGGGGQSSTSSGPEHASGQDTNTSHEESSSSSSSGFGRFSSAVNLDNLNQIVNSMKKDLHDTLRPHEDIYSMTKSLASPFPRKHADEDYTGTTEIVAVPREETRYEKVKMSLLEKFPFLGKVLNIDVSKTAAYKKGQEIVEDLKDKYETSDHPMVHKVEDMKARYFSGSEASRAMLTIRQRDPGFDINHFSRAIKLDAPIVARAFLTHDMEVLRKHCGPELMERFAGIFKHFAEQGLYEDPTLLHVGEVEIVEVRMMDDDPFIIAQFHCQQLKCTRDKFGNVVEGSTDTIQRVYYFWGLQQEKESQYTIDGRMLPPRWVIRDMMWQSMMALV